MDRWNQYLFESHPESTLRDWAKRLHLFRFFRAYGGHANDGDSLDVAYKYSSEGELRRFLGHLGIDPVIYDEMPLQPKPGVSYSGEEFARFPSLVAATEWIEQPGHCRIAGQPAFVWCERDTIKISLGEQYRITESHVTAAEEIEKLLSSAPLELVDPPVDNAHCICPKYYPAYFG
jgi:hypothetical protein